MLRAVILLSFFVSGCAFYPGEMKDGKEDQSEAGSLNKGLVSLDWSDEVRDIDQHLKTTREIKESKTAEFSSNDPVTLPVDVPENLWVALKVPSALIHEDLKFARPTFDVEGYKYDLQSEIQSQEKLKDGTTLVSLKVIGFGILFPRPHSLEGTLILELFGPTEKQVTTFLTMRTPPSHLQREPLTMLQAASQLGEEKDAFLEVHLEDRLLTLIQAFKVTNNEKHAVELSFALKRSGEFRQWRKDFVHRDTGCGATVDQRSYYENFSNEIFFLKLTSTIVRDANALLRDEMKNEVQLPLQPGQEEVVGVYAVGPGANHWFKNGPKETHLYDTTVKGECYKECEYWEIIISPGPDNGAPRRYCSRWANLRRDQTVKVGTEAETPVLTFPDALTWNVRFLDRPFEQDSEQRSLKIAPRQTSIKWN